MRIGGILLHRLCCVLTGGLYTPRIGCPYWHISVEIAHLRWLRLRPRLPPYASCNGQRQRSRPRKSSTAAPRSGLALIQTGQTFTRWVMSGEVLLRVGLTMASQSGFPERGRPTKLPMRRLNETRVHRSLGAAIKALVCAWIMFVSHSQSVRGDHEPILVASRRHCTYACTDLHHRQNGLSSAFSRERWINTAALHHSYHSGSLAH